MGQGNPLVHPYQVYSVLGGEQNKHLAGAGDLASAVTLAGAVFVASQDQMSGVPLLCVYDDTGEAVAFIGDVEKVV
jgi:hypothetical protein